MRYALVRALSIFTIGAVLSFVSVIALWIIGSTAPDSVLQAIQVLR